ncbi:dicarboxylate/amino acid:cation symporter [Parelusimicrobium proximum]|uniref:dicarboxylate/amino acid:cation symporter n=1 Tax=Parelusimicrobium proximum TaxID=3228953 RepID=UPI003D16A35C
MIKKLASLYLSTSLLKRIVAALILGCITGILLGNVMIASTPLWQWIAPLGTIFIKLLRMVVVPIVLFSLIVGTASIEPSKLGRIGTKILAFYIGTCFVSGFLGIFMANIFGIGKGFVMKASAVEAAEGLVLEPMSAKDILLNIIPTNPFASLSNMDVLQIIFFAMIFGLALAFCKDSKKCVIKDNAQMLFNFFSAISEVMFMIVRWVMQYAPIGVFALMVQVFAENGLSAIKPLAHYLGVLYLGFIIIFVVFYSIYLKALGGLSWTKFISLAKTPIITAFVTRTSNGTLPLTMETSEDEMGINRSVGSFTLPLGATINMNGIPLQQCLSVFFIAGAVGMQLTFGQQMLVVLLSVLGSIGAAGVPSGAMIMLLVVLNSLGLDATGGSIVAAAYAMLLSVDPIADMGQTCVNVTGDLVGTAIVAKSEGEMDMEKWK